MGDINKHGWMVELLVELNCLMASVHQKPRSPYWMAKFRAEDGRIVMRSTKQEKRQAAQEVANEWERAARKARRGELTQTVILKTMGEMMERTLGESLNLKSTKQFFAYYLAAPGRKSGTQARYKPVFDNFLASIGNT